tara:strand:+ start:345 stop:782 length:438 start_codon:yes stop_codon:yes gene_type:complete
MSETVSNTEEPKCWWRYNNQGGKYMTCNYTQEGANYKRNPRPTPRPRITPEQFVEQEGTDYSDMSKAQKNEYHRLDMAQRRNAQRAERDEIVDAIVKNKKSKKAEKQKEKQKNTERKEKKKKKKEPPRELSVKEIMDLMDRRSPD